MAYGDERLSAHAESLAKGEDPVPISARILLIWFGFERRGRYVVRWIRQALERANLATQPDFDSVWLDAPIRLLLLNPVAAAHDGGEGPVKQIGEELQPPEVPFIGGAVPDPTHRVGKLEAANRGVVSVSPNDSIERAITLMLAHGYSQRPVMTSEREVKGSITWESVARRFVLSGPCASVNECMDTAREILADASLFAAIPEVTHHQYVLVRDSQYKRITGIITGADLSIQFQQLAEPFLLLGEIEHQIRHLIENKFTGAELSTAKDPSDTERAITSVADLTFGECVRLLENENSWKKLGLKIDRVEFVKEAHRIREIRNDVMHFDPDPMGTASLNG